MTYNAHACFGADGVLDVARIAQVVEDHGPDLVALQELDVSQERSQRLDQVAILAERLNMNAHFTCACERGGGKYGIATFASQDLLVTREGCLPAWRDEIRAAQWLKLPFGGLHIEVLHTHLSTNLWDRHHQVKALLGSEWLESRLAYPYLIVCGDLNATPFGEVYRALSRNLCDVQRQQPGRSRATWPSWLPLLRLDHIFVGRGFEVTACFVPRNALARQASDHLPLVADLALVAQ